MLHSSLFLGPLLLAPALAAILGAAQAEAPSRAGAASPADFDLPAVDAPIYLKPQRLHLGDGKVLENGAVVVSGGRIQAVGDGLAVPTGAVVIELEGELSPGLVALRDFSTARGEQWDSTRNVMPTADLALAFSSAHRDAKALVEQGITTAVLAAPGNVLVGGLAPVVDPGTGTVLKRGALLCVGAGTRALSFNRYPTSTSSQYAELERLFAAPANGAATRPEQAVFARARQKQLSVLLDVTDRADVQRAAAFAKRNGLTGALVGAVRWGDVAAPIKDAGLSVIVGPFGVGAPGDAAEHAVKAAQAGLRIGFAADAPDNHPALLRATAAQCVRAGLSAGAALRALTCDAAAIAGVADLTGRIAPGLEADLVLWSGAPTDLTSRPLRVWCDGRLVHECEDSADGRSSERGAKAGAQQ